VVVTELLIPQDARYRHTVLCDRAAYTQGHTHIPAYYKLVIFIYLGYLFGTLYFFIAFEGTGVEM
jgi:hypothetical protein